MHMKAALIVDWADFSAALSRLGIHEALPELVATLKRTATETAVARSLSLETLRVYTTTKAMRDDDQQAIWDAEDFQIQSQPGKGASIRDRLVAETAEIASDHSLVIIVTGTRNYRDLRNVLQRRSVQLEVWCDDDCTSFAGHVGFLAKLKLSVSPEDAAPVAGSSLSGVLRVVRTEIIKRVQRQLRKDARLLSSSVETDAAFTILAQKIKDARVRPDRILAWTDETRHWNGSIEVARWLSTRTSIPICEAAVREEGEARHVLNMPQELDAAKSVLIVDDAAFSGSTIRMLREACLQAKPRLSVHSAVLSTLVPPPIGLDFWAVEHSGTDVLFPWGWARSVDQFYDLLKELGSRDRRWMPRLKLDGGVETQLSKDESCSVSLVTNYGQIPMKLTFNEARSSDHMLYIISGKHSVIVEEVSGEFDSGEFIFIPRSVPYAIGVPTHGELLRLEFRNVSSAT